MADVRELGSAPGRRRRPAVLDEQIELSPVRPAARVARHWVMSTLGAAGVCGADNQMVELLSAELVAQALVRGPQRLWVRARYDGTTTRVEVSDDAATVDDPSPAAQAILDALATAWGVLPGPDGVGCTVWVEVASDPF